MKPHRGHGEPEIREADTRRGRLDRVRTAVRDWKAGIISAPEAIARAARAVDITLAGEPVKTFDHEDPGYDD